MSTTKSSGRTEEYTDCLIVTMCDNKPYPHGFAKVAAVHPGGDSAKIDEFIVVADCCPMVGRDTLTDDVNKYTVNLDGMTVAEWRDKFRPSMRLLSIRPVRRR